MKDFLKTIIEPSKEDYAELCQRPAMDSADLSAVIDEVFENVKSNGDNALRIYTQKFDGVNLENLRVQQSEVQEAAEAVSDELKSAIDQAYDNIYTFHNAQKTDDLTVTISQGIECRQVARAIENVGLYIPGGTAPLFSTILMLAIPAQIAGCDQIVLCSPPQKDGKLPAAVLYAARKCGISEIYKVGGSQAIAAMALGTESIAKVDKIFGPGNQYVTAAKMKAFSQGIAIDMPAGPSELLVYADETSIPAFVASDLLSQAEHGADSQVVLVATDEDIIKKTQLALSAQVAVLPRKEIAEGALINSFGVVIKDKQSAFDFINAYAPEHFIIASDKDEDFMSLVKNAGSVFIGNYSPESAGDYASGTNHTLPTNYAARAFSGVNLSSFQKKITVQKLTKAGLKSIAKTIVEMAETEGLRAHANAVNIRMEQLKKEENGL